MNFQLIPIYIPFVLSFLLGLSILSLLNFKAESINKTLKTILGFGLGLGLSSQITFLSFLIFNRLHVDFLMLVHIVLIISLQVLRYLNSRRLAFTLPTKRDLINSIPILFILCLSIPLWHHAHFYAFGGWDAWQVWNLKAKFLFLGATDWNTLFSPTLWRSSPHYPLMLPSLITWGWGLQDQVLQEVPILTSYLFTILTIGLLFAGLRFLTKSLFSIVPVIILFTLPFYIKNALSQYCDIVVSFYLLAALFCLLLAKVKNDWRFALLCGLFLGILSFTKPEGAICSLIIGLMSFPYLAWSKKLRDSRNLLLGIILGSIITIIIPAIFYLCLAPENQTMINGLTSQLKPSRFSRLKIILGFYWIETMPVILKNGISNNLFINPNWNGIWILLAAGNIWGNIRKRDTRLILFPAFLFLYIFITTAYYFINTHFKIDWWLQVSLFRILFALLPVAIVWTFLSLWGIKDKKAN